MALNSFILPPCLVLLFVMLSVGVSISGNHEKQSQGSNSRSLAGKMSCSSFPACTRDLSESLGGHPLEVAISGAEAALSDVDQALALAKKLSTQKGNGLENMAVEDCLELLDGAKDQLSKTIRRLSSLSGPAVSQLTNVKMWISTALSYQTTCAGGFYNQRGSITNEMLAKQADVSNVLTNALYMADRLSKQSNSLSSMHLRKLRSVESSINAFPEWLSSADRKLLQSSAPSPSMRLDAVVALDGSGQYTSIQEAVNSIPHHYKGRYVIHIKEGVYNEIVTVPKKLKYVTFLGDGVGKTIISGNRNVASQLYTTYRSATVAISAERFIARAVTFRNTAGPSGHQAVALRAGNDHIVFDTCSFEGYQDTLYSLSSRQFYRNCTISGTVDFIFGNAAAVFQNCQLLARRPLQEQQNTYTAHGRKVAVDPTGFSFKNCKVTAAEDLRAANYSVPTFLGRPWKTYSRTVFMNSYLDRVVNPAGWLAWNASNPFENTLYYGEYQNTGPGSGITARVKWPGVHSQMSFAEADSFSVEKFISGTTWLSEAGVRF